MRLRLLMIGPAIAAVTLLGGAANAPVHAFKRIQPGAWQLHALDKSVPDRRLCIDDPYELVQLRHPGMVCSRFLLANDPQVATIHYTCPGSGYGRTTVKVESGQLIRVESQGLVNHAPFEVAFEGRRVGECTRETAIR